MPSDHRQSASASSSTKIVQVSNISPQATREQIYQTMSFLGKIDEIKIYPSETNPNYSSMTQKLAYIRFMERDSVSTAQHLTNTVFIDRALICVPVPENRIPEEDMALKTGGPTWPGQRQLPPNVVNQIQNSGDQQVVVTIDPTLGALGLPAYPSLPANMEASKIEEIRRTIYVGNLPKECPAADIMQFFNDNIGEVMYLRLAGNEILPVKYAYIEFSSQHSVPTALQNNGIEFQGTKLRIQHSRVAIIKPQRKTEAMARLEIEEAFRKQNNTGPGTGTLGSTTSRALDFGLRREVDRMRSRSPSRRLRSRSPRRRRSSRGPAAPFDEPVAARDASSVAARKKSPLRKRSSRSRSRDRRARRHRSRSKSAEKKRSVSSRDHKKRSPSPRDKKSKRRSRSRSKKRDTSKERKRDETKESKSSRSSKRESDKKEEKKKEETSRTKSSTSHPTEKTSTMSKKTAEVKKEKEVKTEPKEDEEEESFDADEDEAALRERLLERVLIKKEHDDKPLPTSSTSSKSESKKELRDKEAKRKPESSKRRRRRSSSISSSDDERKKKKTSDKKKYRKRRRSSDSNSSSSN